MDMNNNGSIFSGTKDVAENLKFDEIKLQEWFGDSIPGMGKILQIAQFKGGQSNPTYKISTERKNFVLRRKPPRVLFRIPMVYALTEMS
jgi:aminoglycoside phosphotransferase (APT) family kinase protein